MATKQTHPTNLLEALRFFSDLDVATEFVAKLRWPDGPTCPRCQGKDYSYLKTRRLWKCKGCQKQYSAKQGTFMEDSPLGLDKWMAAIWIVSNCKNGVSSHEMARSLGITQKSAWFMLHRIRLGMKQKSMAKFSGEVESDETFIGGRASNMHPVRRAKTFGPDARRNRAANKSIVMGIKDRETSRIRTHVIDSFHRDVVQQKIREAVLPGSFVYTDKMSGYSGIDAFDEYQHAVVDHAERYVDGRVHVNGVENFWSLLKRTIKGTYVVVEARHLTRYLDEQVYRYNERHGDDSDRFIGVVEQSVGKRVTWKELTAKDS